ncbi:MAG TPA: glycosyltransferase family 2 protein [Candidatus Polarisedimenticolia bacterium]|jgi:hypothetical protein
MPVRVAVVIPALNEERSLPMVLDALSRVRLRAARDGSPVALSEVIVVDNGSVDATAAVAARQGALVLAEARRGYGRACLKALDHLAADPPGIVVFLDADFSDDPSLLPELVLPIADGEYDFVPGSRLLGVREPGALLPQARIGNALSVALIRLLYGFRYTDLGPFRAIRWSSLARLGMRDTTFGWTAEMQVKALRAGLRVMEVPVPYRRRVGVSKITGTLSGTIRAGGKILWTIARHRFGAGAGAEGSNRVRGPS